VTRTKTRRKRPAFDEDRTRGLYRKFYVGRTDGSSEPGGKHDGCDYFVLDLDHDRHAVHALMAYAESCMHDYPILAQDLLRKAGLAMRRLDRERGRELQSRGLPRSKKLDEL